MRCDHIADVEEEMARLKGRIEELIAKRTVSRRFEGENHFGPSPEAAAVRRASMDLSRALIKLRERNG